MELKLGGGKTLIKMPLYDQPNLTGGVDEALVQVAEAVPSFIVGLLLFVWSIVFLGGMSSQRRRSGFSDAPMWATLASISTMLVTLMLTLKQGMVSGEILGIVIAVTIFSGLWLFLSKGRGEV